MKCSSTRLVFEVNSKSLESHGNSLMEPVLDFTDQTDMVMSPILKMSKGQEDFKDQTYMVMSPLMKPLKGQEDFKDQTYIVMSPIKKMSKGQDDIFYKGSGQKSYEPDNEYWRASDGSISTYSFSGNQLTHISNEMRQNRAKSSCEHQQEQKNNYFHSLWAVPVCIFFLVVLTAGMQHTPFLL